MKNYKAIAIDIYPLILVAIASIILILFSSFRLAVFRAGTDLGFFDQLLYLISQGLTPISSILEGVHPIGDHGALVLYPISLLYFIHPNVHWLLAVQAIALTSGAIPVYALSLSNGLSVGYARAVATSYILYPALFNISFYTELRTETIAVPALLWAIWAIDTKRWWQGAIAILVVLSSKETMSLTVVGLGVWWLWQRRIIWGIGCIVAGISWFVVAATYIIPSFRGGHPMAGTWHYSSIGDSLGEIAIKSLTQPQVFLVRALSGDRLFYYLLLLLPIIIGLHWRKIAAMIPALPMLGLNILSDYPGQRDLIHHYSLPIIPFLFVWLIYSLRYFKRHQQRLWLSRRLLIVWSAIAFLAMAKYGYFWERYLPLLDNASAVNDAISLIQPEDRVLTTGFIAPHLSHRPVIKLIEGEWDLARMNQYQIDTVLIAMQHLGFDPTLEAATAMIDRLSKASEFDLVYQQQDVFLFQKP
ncbi:MAG: DUF2079 domain-containing protein [Pleurocapsa sp.]